MTTTAVTPEQIVAVIDKAFPGAAQGKKDWYADSSKAPHVRTVISLLEQMDQALLPVSGDQFVTLTAIREAMGHSVQRWDGGDNAYQMKFTPGPVSGNPVALLRDILAAIISSVPAESALPSRPTEPESHVLKGYEIINEIGAGGFGQVFLCNDSETSSRQVAVKVLKPSALSGEDDPEKRFLREAEALFRLKHRAIVAYHGFGRTQADQPYPYLVMDYVEGINLDDASSEMDIGQKVGAVIEMLDGLAHAHEQRVLHRDIKPCNVLVRRSDGQVTIVDFGLAYVLDGLSSKSVTTHYLGSHGYIPQEVIADPKHRAVTHDIYSTGVVLYQMVAGRLPNIQTYDGLASIDTNLAGLDRIIQRALAPEVNRYSTAREFQTELGDWLLRHTVTSSMGPSPLSAKFREKLQEQEQIRQGEIDSRQQKAAEHERLWREQHSLVMAAATAAFSEILPILQDNGQPYELQTEQEEIAEGNELAIVLTLVRRDPHREVNVGVSWKYDRPLGEPGAPGIVIDWPKASKTGPVAPKRRLMRPFWVIFTAGQHQSPSRVLHGSIVAVALGGRSDDIVLHGRPPRFVSAGISAPQTPEKLQTPASIRDYVIKILAAVFRLTLD